MALTLSAEFTREVSNSESSPAWLVNIGSLTNGKFVKAARNVLGYPASVKAINSRASSIDPVTCQVTLSELSVDFIEDGAVRSLVANNYLHGKTLTVSLGFDTGSDSTFAEGKFVQFHQGIIDAVEAGPGFIRIICRDARTVAWERRGSTTVLPAASAAAMAAGYVYSGLAVSAMADILSTAGVPSSLYDSTSFDPANCSLTGYMCVERVRVPQFTNTKAVSDRRLLKPTPIKDLLETIARVLRGYILVLEDGLIRYKEFNNGATVTDRFTASDISVGSFKQSAPTSKLITAVVARTLWEGLADNGGPGYRVTVRDSSSTDQTNWGFTGGTAWSASETIEDDWFGAELAQPEHADIGSGDTTIVVTSGGGVAPLTGNPDTTNGAVDASHPGYLFVVGIGSSDTGEIIKYTSVTKNVSGWQTTYTLGGLTRGMFGTSAAAHSWTSASFPFNGPLHIYEITGPIRAAEKLINRFSNGYPVVEFKTPLHKFGVQLADVVYLESDVYIRKGVDTLAVGQTTYPFEVIEKDVDPETNEITWKLMEVTESANTRAIVPNVIGQIAGGGTGAPGPIGGLGSLVGGASLSGPALTGIIRGAAAATSANLTHTIPAQTAIHTAAGVVSLADTSHTHTASKDTYVDINPLPGGKSLYEYTEVANGAAAPSLATGRIRLFKVVTNGTAITSVTDLRMNHSGFATTSPASFQPNANVTSTQYSAVYDEVGTNYCTNPSFETGTTGWSVQGSSTLAQDLTTYFMGNASMKVTMSATPATGPDGAVFTDIAAVSGEQWIGTMFLQTDQAGGKSIVVKKEFFTAGLVSLASSSVTATVDNSGWVRIMSGDLPAVAAPATTAWVRFSVYDAGTNGAGSYKLWVDGVQFEKNPQPTTYADGDMGPGYAWTGTAHASTSTRTGGLQIIRNLDASAMPIEVDAFGRVRFYQYLDLGPYEWRRLRLGSDISTGRPQITAVGLTSSIDISVEPKGSGHFLVGAAGACFGATGSGTFTANTGAYTKVTGWTEDYDLGGNFSAPTFTAPEAGIYQFNGVAQLAGVVDQKQVILALYKNGSAILTGSAVYASGTSTIDVTVSAQIKLAASDAIELYIWNGDTVNRTAAAGSFSGKRVA